MYSAIVLDEKSQLTLSKWADDNVKINGVRLPILVRDNGWKMICHHMTIKYPGIPEFIKQYVNTEQKLEATHVAFDDNVVAVRVIGFHSDNKNPHITVAVNVRGGGKAVMSNNLTNWTKIEKPLKLKGTVEELQ